MIIRRLTRIRVFERLEHRYLLSVGDPYNVPANPRVSQNLDAAWKFALNPTGSPQSVGYDDSSWSAINLPYTWDGMTVGPVSGTGWYRKTITVDASLLGTELYLEFGGAYQVTSLYIDGAQVDFNPNASGVNPHNGGFGEFDFDVTGQLTAGSHLLAISVNNQTNSNISPAGAGDYTKQGGLYRDVTLVAVAKASHIAQIESAPGTATPVATPGVYFSNSSVVMGIASADIHVQSVLDNLSAATSSVNVTSYLVDTAGIIQAQVTSSAALAAGQTSVSVSQSATVANPHLWNGRIDPYLYALYVEVADSSTGALLDLSQQLVGIRSFKINAQPNPSDPNPANQDQAAFELNGLPYALVGVNTHQDDGAPGQLGAPKGWAQTAPDIQQQVDLVMQLGATFVRTAHYEYSQEFYEDADKAGLIVQVDGDLQGTITSTTLGSAFVNNYEDQLTEEVKQNYNHPSVIAYSMYNEIGSSVNNATLISNLSTFVHGLDPSRYTSADTDDGNNNPAANSIDTVTDLLGEHLYGGWYVGGLANDGSFLDTLHNNKPALPIAVTEYGAGASAYQYTTNILLPPPDTTSRFHPENSQSQLEEIAYAQFASRNYLWSIALWNMTDFSISTRHEGDTLGQNDKGLITRDRSTYKDSFYFYQANWNDPARSWANTPVLYISDHTWTDRTTPSASMTVYSNLGAPTLWENGVQIGTMVPLVLSGIAIPDTYTMSSALALAAGANNIQVRAIYNTQTYTNSVVWNYHPPALSGSLYALFDFTDTAGNVQAGYQADTGQAFSGSFGWVDSTTLNPVANTAGTYNRTTVTTAPFDQLKARTGILLPANRIWEYALPNGVYDVHVVSADSNNTSTSPNNIVNNISVNGNLLHDIDSTSAYGDNGFDEFYTTVTVTNGFLRVSAGAGSVNPVLAYIDINVIDNTPPSVVGSSVQHTAPEQLQVQFSKDVSTSLAASDLVLVNQTTGETVDPANVAVSYNSATNTATFIFPGYPGGFLPVGNYQATISAASVTDAAGNPLTADFNTPILQIVGDWDVSGQLDVADVGAMMGALSDLSGYQSLHGLASAQLNLLGDGDHDNHVTNADLQSLLVSIANGGGGSQSAAAAVFGAAADGVSIPITPAVKPALAQSAFTAPAPSQSSVVNAASLQTLAAAVQIFESPIAAAAVGLADGGLPPDKAQAPDRGTASLRPALASDDGLTPTTTFRHTRRQAVRPGELDVDNKLAVLDAVLATSQRFQ
jgi:beta-galactosidase